MAGAVGADEFDGVDFVPAGDAGRVEFDADGVAAGAFGDGDAVFDEGGVGGGGAFPERVFAAVGEEGDDFGDGAGVKAFVDIDFADFDGFGEGELEPFTAAVLAGRGPCGGAVGVGGGVGRAGGLAGAP